MTIPFPCTKDYTIPLLHQKTIPFGSPSVPKTTPFPFCTKDFHSPSAPTDYSFPLLHQQTIPFPSVPKTTPFPFCTTDLYSHSARQTIPFPFCTKDFTIPLLHHSDNPFCTTDYTIPLLHHSDNPFCTADYTIPLLYQPQTATPFLFVRALHLSKHPLHPRSLPLCVPAMSSTVTE